MTWRNSTFRGRDDQDQWGTSPVRGARLGRDSRPSPGPPVGKLIKTIPSRNHETDDQEHCGITNVELVASYNWIDGPDARIVVPGKPRLWTPPEGPQKLCQDSGVFYNDCNAASYQSHPMEPAVVSVLRMHPAPLSVDIVCCSATLIRLLQYVRGVDKPLRMLVEVVGQTLHLIIPRDVSPTYGISCVGHGHAFLEAYTSWEPGFGRSLSHQRILKYRLGGLDLLVRYQAHGYVGAGQRTRTAASEDTLDALGQTGSLRLHQDGSSMASNNEGLVVASAGGPTSQDSIMEIKTRTSSNARNRKATFDVSKHMPRLWIRQVPTLVLAYHTEGLFDLVKVHDVSTALKEWEAEKQTDLRQLVALLRLLARDAMADDGGKLELVSERGGDLELRRRLPDAGTAFSPSVGRQWGGWLDEGRKKGRANEPFDGHDWWNERLTACDRECGYCGKCMY